MSSGWDIYHRRAKALRRVVTHLDSSATQELPWDRDLAQVFQDRGDVLLGLHELWKRRLLGRVDLALEIDAQPAEESVALAWREVANELPSVRRVLDQHGAHPALAASLRHEHRMLAVAAGLATLGDPAAVSARIGQRFVERLRATADPPARGGRLTDRVAALVRRVPRPALG